MVEYEIGDGEDNAQTYIPFIVIYIHTYIHSTCVSLARYTRVYIYMYLKAYIYSFLEGQFRRVKGIISAE